MRLGRRYVDPGEQAEDVLRLSGAPRLDNGVAIDVEAIAWDFFRFQVKRRRSLAVGGRRLIGLYVPDYNVVMAEASNIEQRVRFTIAHELGHARLEFGSGVNDMLFEAAPAQSFGCSEHDADLKDLVESRAGLRRRAEIRANIFAANLLMPTDLVRETWRSCARDEYACADKLGVSREALGYRLKQLRLV